MVFFERRAMKKTERVKSKILFNEIINKGKKVSNNIFTVFFVEKEFDKPLFGISAPKKCGNAVIRNKLKRQMRELLHKNKTLFPKNRNYIIIVKKAALEISFSEMDLALKKIIGDLNEK